MSIIMDTLRALLAGDHFEQGRLLPTCTAEAFGAETFGEIAIRELFARNPVPLSPTPHLILADRYAAVFDADASGCEQALFLETYDGRIARLWRLGEGSMDVTAEPKLRTAMDPFMNQNRETVAFDAQDFPHLDPVAAPAVAGALRETVDGRLEVTDTADRRVIALRAFSAGPLTAVLAQVIGPRTPPLLIAIALRLDSSGCVRAWRVLDRARVYPVLDDLTMGLALRDGKSHNT